VFAAIICLPAVLSIRARREAASVRPPAPAKQAEPGE
jgi:hypothetical protein